MRQVLNSDQDNERFDEKFQEIAQAIADGIMETIGDENEVLKGIYRVQIGLYRNFSNAQYVLNRAVADGYEGISFIRILIMQFRSGNIIRLMKQ